MLGNNIRHERSESTKNSAIKKKRKNDLKTINNINNTQTEREPNFRPFLSTLV